MTSNVQSTNRASAFAASVGVNTHLNDYAGPYGNIPGILSDLAYLGLTQIRDDTPESWTISNYQTVAAAGIKLDLLIGYNPGEEMANGGIQRDLGTIAQVIQSTSGSVIGLEGLNEPNNFANTWNGQPTDNWATVAAVQQAEYAAVRSVAAMAGIPLLDASVDPDSFPGTLPDMAPYANLGNAHVYPYNGGQPTLVMDSIMAGQQQLVPGKPQWITEFGYSSSYEDPSNYGVSQNVQTKNTLNGLLDAFKDGVPLTFLYQLADETSAPSVSSLEDGFGLFSATGVAKPVAVGLHNLTTILNDSGATARSFTPQSLAYTLSGLPSTGNSLLFEKSNGTFDLVVWNEATDWNYQSKAEIGVAASPVTINLGASYQTIQVFDPLQGAAPISTLSDVDSVEIGLTDHPLIIQVSPAQTSTTKSTVPTTISVTAPTTTVAAQYGVSAAASGITVSDSSATEVLGLTLSAKNGTLTMLNASGGQASGSGSSTVSFSGTAALLNSQLNTLTFTGTTTGAGSVSATITNAAGETSTAVDNVTVGPDTLSLFLSEDSYNGNAKFVVKVNGSQIGNGRVTTLHKTGNAELFSYQGNWGASPTIEVDFVNDLYGGSAKLDRNLYVNAIQYNGVSQMSHTVPLFWNSGTELVASHTS